jgi:hypothetical protein
MAEYRPADRAADFTLAWLRRFRHFSLRSEAKVGTRGNYGVGLSLIFGMGPDPVDGGWRFTADKLARVGQAVVTVYRDENGNGRRDGGEEPVEGVEIEGAYGIDTRVTNGEGKVVVDGLRPFVPVRLAVETDSLPDPMLMPKGKGVVVVPRPGIPSEISLALAPTGQVEGTLLAVDGTPREGAEIELVDEKGLAIAKTVSEFDGYFLFESVPYGSYRLRLGESTASALGVQRELGVAVLLQRGHVDHKAGTLRLAANGAAEQVIDSQPKPVAIAAAADEAPTDPVAVAAPVAAIAPAREDPPAPLPDLATVAPARAPDAAAVAIPVREQVAGSPVRVETARAEPRIALPTPVRPAPQRPVLAARQAKIAVPAGAKRAGAPLAQTLQRQRPARMAMATAAPPLSNRPMLPVRSYWLSELLFALSGAFALMALVKLAQQRLAGR